MSGDQGTALIAFIYYIPGIIYIPQAILYSHIILAIHVYNMYGSVVIAIMYIIASRCGTVDYG